MSVGLQLKTDAQLAQVRKLFDRSADYGALVQKIRQAKDSFKRLGPRKARTAVERLQRAFDRLCALDFFPGPAKGQAAEAMSALKRELHLAFAPGEPRPSRKRLKPLDRAKYQKRLWATRKDPWIDRLATAWLIKRFIDPAARFAWIGRPSERPGKAVGFDFDGARFTHVGTPGGSRRSSGASRKRPAATTRCSPRPCGSSITSIPRTDRLRGLVPQPEGCI